MSSDAFELLVFGLFLAELYFFVRKHAEYRFTVLAEVITVAAQRPFNLEHDFRGVLPNGGRAEHIHPGDFAEGNILVLDKLPAVVLVRPFQVLAVSIGVEVRNGFAEFLSGIAHR